MANGTPGTPDPNQPNPNLGSNKTIASAMGGAVVTVLCWVTTLFGVTVPAEVAAALATIVSTLLVFFVPHRFGQGG